MLSALIIDPDKVAAEQVADCLTDLGIQSNLCESAEEALSGVLSHDIYISEAVLPGIDGVQLTRLLRAFTNAPVLLLSCCKSTPWKVAAFYAGADRYAHKPFDSCELKLAVMSCLRRAGKEI